MLLGLLGCGPTSGEGDRDEHLSSGGAMGTGDDAPDSNSGPDDDAAPGDADAPGGSDGSEPEPGDTCDHCDDDLSCCHGDLYVLLTEPTPTFALSLVEIDAEITCTDGVLVSVVGIPADTAQCLADMTGVRIIGDTYDNAYGEESLTASLDGGPAAVLRFDGKDYVSCDCNAAPADVTFSFPECPCDGDVACTESPALDQSCGQDVGATCCDNAERLECGACGNECAWTPAC